MAKQLRLVVALGGIEFTADADVPEGWDDWSQEAKDDFGLELVDGLEAELIEGWYEEVDNCE